MRVRSAARALTGRAARALPPARRAELEATLREHYGLREEEGQLVTRARHPV